MIRPQNYCSALNYSIANIFMQFVRVSIKLAMNNIRFHGFFTKFNASLTNMTLFLIPLQVHMDEALLPSN